MCGADRVSARRQQLVEPRRENGHHGGRYAIRKQVVEFVRILHEIVHLVHAAQLVVPDELVAARAHGLVSHPLHAGKLGVRVVLDEQVVAHLCGIRGEGRQQQLQWVRQRTDAAIAELEAKRAAIDATLAELKLINSEVRKQL